MKKKIRPAGELAFVIGTLLLPLGTSMMARADFGLSVVVVPAYLLSLKVGPLTFGMAEYCLQGLLLLLFCLLMGKFRLSYLFSFFAAFIYGVVLDLWMPVIAAVQLPTFGSRLLLYIGGELLNTLSIAFYFRSYFPPQMYELLVKGLSGKYGVELGKFKIGYDLTSCVVGLLLSFLFFGRIRGIGIGSIVCAFVNGLLISWWGKQIDKLFDFTAKFPRWQAFFALQEKADPGQ